METLEVTKTNAIKAYQAADAKGRKMLADLYGEKTFLQKITDRVKTVEDAYEAIGINPGEININTAPPVMEDDLKSIYAYYKLIAIVRALNEGWVPDWSDGDQAKYYPYFKMNPGFGFSYAYCDGWHSDAGSRLCFKTRELAEYAGKQFESIYNDFLTIQP